MPDLSNFKYTKVSALETRLRFCVSAVWDYNWWAGSWAPKSNSAQSPRQPWAGSAVITTRPPTVSPHKLPSLSSSVQAESNS